MILTQSLVQSRNHQQNVKVLWKRACEAKRIYELKCREEVGSNQFYHQEVARCGKTSKEAEKVRFISLTHTREERKSLLPSTQSCIWLISVLFSRPTPSMQNPSKVSTCASLRTRAQFRPLKKRGKVGKRKRTKVFLHSKA